MHQLEKINKVKQLCASNAEVKMLQMLQLRNWVRSYFWSYLGLVYFPHKSCEKSMILLRTLELNVHK